MDDRAFDSTTSLIYSAASGLSRWDEALTSLSNAISGFAAQLIAVDKRSGGVQFSHVGGQASAHGHLEYVRSYHRIDPRAPVLMAPQSQGWLHCHTFIPEERAAVDPFYQDFLIPIGGRYCSGIKVVDDAELVVMLGVHRGFGSSPLEPDTIAWLDRVRLHLVEAMAIYRHLSNLHAERTLGKTIIDGLRQPVILLDELRGIRYANAAARDCMAARDVIVDRQGRLACCRAEDESALTAALIQLALQAPSGGSQAYRRHVRLRGADGRPIGISCTALRPADVMGAFGPWPTAMLLIHDAARSPALDPVVLGEFLDLTPAEARVAVMLAEGASADQVAKRRGVSIGTVRTQIRSLQSKTGAPRQSEIVRRVLMMAQGC